MSTDIRAKKSKRMGRPAVDTEAVNVRLERSQIEEIDAFRRGEKDIPGRPEAIRRLLAVALNPNRQ